MPDMQQNPIYQKQSTHMKIAFQQGCVNDLQQFLLGFDGGDAIHKGRSAGLMIGVIQFLHQLTSFLKKLRVKVKRSKH